MPKLQMENYYYNLKLCETVNERGETETAEDEIYYRITNCFKFLTVNC